MLFDTHAHYDDEAFDPDRELLLESLPQLPLMALLRKKALRLLMQNRPRRLLSLPLLPSSMPMMLTALSMTMLMTSRSKPK